MPLYYYFDMQGISILGLHTTIWRPYICIWQLFFTSYYLLAPLLKNCPLKQVFRGHFGPQVKFSGWNTGFYLVYIGFKSITGNSLLTRSSNLYSVVRSAFCCGVGTSNMVVWWPGPSMSSVSSKRRWEKQVERQVRTAVRRIEVAKGKYARTHVCLTMKTTDLNVLGFASFKMTMETTISFGPESYHLRTMVAL